jgi:hypothetical protein
MTKRLAIAALVTAVFSAATGVHATSLSNPWGSVNSGGTSYSPGAGINISGSTISSAPISPTRTTISSSAYTANGSGSAANVQYDLTLANNVTITLASGQDGQHAVFHICQDANGARTLSWAASGATINWLASRVQPTLSTGADACDLFGFIYLNGAWYEDAYEPNTAPDYVSANSTASLNSLTLSAPLGLDSGGTGTAAPTTVAGLPTCAGAGKGLVDTVTDSAGACVAGNTLAGGGTNVCRVMCDGSAWRIMGSALGPGTPVGWPLTGYFSGQRNGSNWGCTPNGSRVIGIEIPAAVTFGHFDCLVNTADTVSGDSYDVGLYSSSGALQAHTGPINLNSTGYQSVAVSGGGTVTIEPGKYYLAFGCGTAATAQIEGNGSSSASFAVNVAGPATSGGTLPTTMTPPADAWGEVSWYLGLH